MAIKAKFSVDNSELKKGLKDAENQAQSSMKKIADTAQGASGGFKGILGVLSKLGPYGKMAAVAIGVIVGAVAAVIAGVHKLAGKMDNIAKASKGVNLTTTAFQALSHASKKCGVEMEFVQKVLTKIQYQLAQADKGTKEVVDAFAALGLSWSELDKLPPEQQLLAVIQAAEKISDISQRNKILFKLFDKKDIQALNKLIDVDYGRMVANAKNMGVIIDEDAIRLAEAYNDSLGTANERLAAVVANWQATKDIMKGIKEMMDEVSQSITQGNGKVPDQFKAVYIGIGDAAEDLEKRLKENDKSEYQRIQKRIKEVAKLKAMEESRKASGRQISESTAEKLAYMYMDSARKEVMFQEVAYRDSRFDPNNKDTWVQKREVPLAQSVFDKEKIKADKVRVSVQGIIKELEKKRKKHDEQLRSYNKEINIQKEIARIEAETGGKLTDDQKAELAKSLLEYQVERNKDIVGLIEQQTSRMSDEFQIQKALLDGDTKRVEMLKAILKLKEQGITVSEEDFANSEDNVASLQEQLDDAKKRQSWLAPAKEQYDRAQTTVADTSTRINVNNLRIRENLKQQDARIGYMDVKQDEIDSYERGRMSLVRENTALVKRRNAARATVRRNASSVAEYNRLEQQIKELEGRLTEAKAIQAAKDQMLKAQEQKKELDRATIGKMARDTKVQNDIVQSQLKGDYERANMLKLINELKSRGVTIDEQELQRNKAKYKALLDQIKIQRELTLKQNMESQGHSILMQAMKQAGFSKKAAELEAVRNAERVKGAKLTKNELATVKKLANLQQELNDPMNKLNFRNLDIKTNEMTARGGFSTGAVKVPVEDVNRQIRDFSQRQVQILNNIYSTLRSGGII